MAQNEQPKKMIVTAGSERFHEGYFNVYQTPFYDREIIKGGIHTNRSTAERQAANMVDFGYKLLYRVHVKRKVAA